jgi:hypothetical protein
MKRLLSGAAILLVVISAFLIITLPPRPMTLAAAGDGTIAGSVHIHTTRSDGRSTPDEIAKLAAQLGQRFVVFADHGDGMRVIDPPAYRSGVLCIDGIEVSTNGGHYVALDMPSAPYPLAGEARDVVDDVKRLGGFGIASHPDSPKPDLRWHDWTAPVDAVEWVNPDTSWRVHAAGPWPLRLRLVAAIFHYPIRPAETVASLTTPPDQTMTHWNALVLRRKIVGLAGDDAHAKLEFRNSASGDNRYSVPIPSYDASLRTLSVHLTPERPLSGNAADDGAVVMRAIRGGHLYIAMDAIASPPSFEFTATNALGTAHEGDELAVGGPVTLHVRSNAPAGFTTILWRGRQMLATEQRNEFTIPGGQNPAVYRVEIRSTEATRQITWLFSNPIYVRAPQASTTSPEPVVGASTPLFDGHTLSGWHVETDATSTAALVAAPTPAGAELQLRYTLSPGPASGQRAAMVWGTPDGRVPAGMGSYRQLKFSARADRPMRISVQLRTPDVGRTLRRWQRSVYVDTAAQEHVVEFDDLTPSPGTEAGKPPLDQVNAILLVVDTVNTKPGSSGTLWVTDPALQK